MSLNPSSSWQIAVLLSAVCAAAAAATTKCPKNYDCETVETCADRHGGASRLDSVLIFNCEEQGVCCPPVFRNTASARILSRRTNKEKELRKRRVRNRQLFDKHCGKLSSKRVNGPTDGGAPGKLPWMALLSHMGSASDKPSFHCGGTLITDRYVLTAAHCVQGKYRHNLMVRLGEYDTTMDPDCPKKSDSSDMDSVQLSTTESPAYSENESDEYAASKEKDEIIACYIPSKMDFGVEEIIPHKDYGRVGPKIPINDIALLRLNRSVGKFTKYIKPICLPWRDYDPMDDMVIGKNFTIAGWGIDMNGMQSTLLKEGRVQLIDFEDCESILDNTHLVAKTQTCTVQINAYACMGDSGGPLSIFDTNSTSEVQLGVISFSKSGSCRMGGSDPVVYTRVFAFNNWILDSIRPNDDPKDTNP